MKVVVSLTNNEIYEFDMNDIKSITFADFQNEEPVAEQVKEEPLVVETAFVDVSNTPTVSDGTPAVIQPEPANEEPTINDAIDDLLEEKIVAEEPVPVELPSEPIIQTVTEDSNPDLPNTVTSDVGFTEEVKVCAPKVYAVDSAVGEVIYRIDDKRQIRVQVEDIPDVDATPTEV